MDQDEISEKIRKAIKAKLTELGSYIDDELPDYIMVMIANKKDVKQMSSDLELFLGDSAEPFTEWLDNLLTRLQTIAKSVVKAEPKPKQSVAASTNPPAPASTQSKVAAKVKETPVEVIESESDTQSQVPQETALLTLHAQDDEVTFDDDDDDEPITDPLPIAKPMTSKSAGSKTVTSKSVVSKPVVAERKPAAKSSRISSVKSEKSVPSDLLAANKKMISTRGDSEVLIPKAAVQPSRRVAPSSSSSTGLQSRRRSISPPGRGRSGSSSDRRRSPVLRDNRRSAERTPPRRATAISRLGSRPDGRGGRDYRRDDRRDDHRPRDIDRHDDYRPRDIDRREDHRPRDVGRREDHRPRDIDRRDHRTARSRYGDRNMARDRGRRPMWQEDAGRDSRERSPLPTSGLVSQIGSTVQRVDLVSDSSEDEYNPDRPQIGSVASIIQVSKRKSSIPEALQANKKLLLRAMADVTKSLGAPSLDVVQVEEETTAPTVVSPPSNKRPSAKQRIGLSGSARDRLGRRPVADVRTGRSPDYKRRKSRSRSISRSRNRSRSRSRSRSRNRSRVHPLGDYDEEDLLNMLEILRDKRMRKREQTGRRRSHEDRRRDSSGERQPAKQRLDIQHLQKHLSVTDQDESVPNTNFVVTLDGAMDMSKLFPHRKDINYEDDVSLLDLDDTQESVVSDGKTEGDSSGELNAPLILGAEGASLSKIMCRFLPNCKAGSKCPFYHPLCKNYPDCKFGSLCTYTHPEAKTAQCRYGQRCTAPACPFIHPKKPFNHGTKLAAGPTKPVSKTVCRFHPKCTNMDCAFLHPKPCKFGISCMKKNSGCIFTHPTIPSKTQLKWTKPTTETSS